MCVILNSLHWLSLYCIVYKPSRKKKMYKSKQFIRFLFVLILISLFTWWGGRAVFRYLSQPLATDIETSFGDNEIGIRFPLITFCPNFDFLAKNEIVKNCTDEYYVFLIPTVFVCLQKHPNFKIGPFFYSITN